MKIKENVIFVSSKHAPDWLKFWYILFCLEVVENITECMLKNKSHLFLMYKNVYALVASYWSFIFTFDLQICKFLIMIMKWQSIVLYIFICWFKWWKYFFMCLPRPSALTPFKEFASCSSCRLRYVKCKAADIDVTKCIDDTVQKKKLTQNYFAWDQGKVAEASEANFLLYIWWFPNKKIIWKIEGHIFLMS